MFSCASCRKTQIEKPKEEPEESTTSRTGVKIDSKTKVQSEVDKRELRKQIEEDYFEERDKRQEKQINTIQKIESKTIDDKKRLKSFFEKRSTIDTTKKPPASTPVTGGEEHKIQAGKTDVANPRAGEFALVAGEVRRNSPIFKAFKNWLGEAAPIVKATEKMAKNHDKATSPPTSDPVNEYVDKNRGPSSRK